MRAMMSPSFGNWRRLLPAVALAAAGTLLVSVTADEVPVPQAVVEIRRAGQDPVVARGSTGADGRASALELPAGIYDVEIHTKTFPFALVENVVARAGDSFHLAIALDTLSRPYASGEKLQPSMARSSMRGTGRLRVPVRAIARAAVAGKCIDCAPSRGLPWQRFRFHGSEVDLDGVPDEPLYVRVDTPVGNAEMRLTPAAGPKNVVLDVAGSDEPR